MPLIKINEGLYLNPERVFSVFVRKGLDYKVYVKDTEGNETLLLGNASPAEAQRFAEQTVTVLTMKAPEGPSLARIALAIEDAADSLSKANHHYTARILEAVAECVRDGLDNGEDMSAAVWKAIK